MLDFSKLAVQIGSIDKDSFIDIETAAETLANARAALDRAISNPEAFYNRLDNNANWVLWPVALPLEPIEEKVHISEAANNYTVIGVDGSQIMPSHHEVHACYLLNIGKALITYGSKHPPQLESIPQLFSRPEDLYPLVDRRRVHIDELYVSLERTILELELLAESALKAVERGLRVVALYDGSLIPWSVEKLAEGYQSNYMARMIKALNMFKEARIPIIGYLSHSRGADIINCLRILICPYEFSNCKDYCGDINEEDFPCSKVWPMSDRQLLTAHLQLGDRSASFMSGAGVSKLLPRDMRICFSYLNVGEEVARLEFPRFVLDQDPDVEGQSLLNYAASVVLSQCSKGMGYPISLAEAHHLAVIRGHDRDHFFELLTRQLLKLGVNSVKPSPKESKKRVGFV